MKKEVNVVFGIACPCYSISMQTFSAEIAAKMLVEKEGGKGHAKPQSKYTPSPALGDPYVVHSNLKFKVLEYFKAK